MLSWEKFLLLQEEEFSRKFFKQGLCECIFLEVPHLAQLPAVGWIVSREVMLSKSELLRDEVL